MFKRISIFISLILILIFSINTVSLTFAQSSYEELVNRKDNYQDDSEIREREILILALNNANTIIDNTVIEVPLILQTDYPHVPFAPGGRTVASSGCGVTCLTMLANYYLNEDYEPADLIPLFKKHIYGGTGGGAFDESFDIIGLPIEKKTYNFNEMRAALEEGKIVAAIMNSNSIFTSGGHYILLVGINEDGLIMVNDPNGANYNRMPNKFKTGFTDDEIRTGLSGGWIYSAKDFSMYNQALMTRASAMSKLLGVSISNIFDEKLIEMSPSGSILLN